MYTSARGYSSVEFVRPFCIEGDLDKPVKHKSLYVRHLY